MSFPADGGSSTHDRLPVPDNSAQSATSALYYDAYDLGVQKTLLKQQNDLRGPNGPNLPTLELSLMDENRLTPLNLLNSLNSQDGSKLWTELAQAKTPGETDSVINHEISLLNLNQPGNLALADALKNIQSSSRDFNSTEAALDKSLSPAKTENQIQTAVKNSDQSLAAIEKTYANTSIAPEVDLLATWTQRQFQTVDSLKPQELAQTGAIDSDLQSGNLTAFKKEVESFHNNPNEFYNLYHDNVLNPANPGPQSYEIGIIGSGALNSISVGLFNVKNLNDQPTFSTEATHPAAPSGPESVTIGGRRLVS
jgi:hypothetical protein